ncbi:uncharacterized protein, partial [Lepeophtheirus salmonis]|uniref:uncharacterized protein n=1 Tax=Lepeophtheirus salmonis TaxID=72036 RepID=UPI001AEA99A1
MPKTSQTLEISPSSTSSPSTPTPTNTFSIKKNRTELRAFKEAFPLKLISPESRKTQLHRHDQKILKRVTSLSLAERIDLKNLLEFTSRNKGLFHASKNFYGECLAVNVSFDSSKNNLSNANNISVNDASDLDKNLNIVNRDESAVFFFQYGVIVLWGLTENQEAYLIRTISPFLHRKYDLKSIQSETFLYGLSSESYFCNDVFYLETEDDFNKMVISNALAQSVKLDYFELHIEDIISSISELPTELSIRGKLRADFNKKKLMRITGQLFVVQFDLNLLSNILDSPEILWYYSEYEPLYVSLKVCLEIKQRTELLNKRIDTIKSMLDVYVGMSIDGGWSELFKGWSAVVLGAVFGVAL